ncbi:MAG: putative Protein-tyrosine kinase [Verrucomicrobiales bacterium]|nr:putative Protein-tyrosine kinase [Verrucomicrobiales bacterium]
MKSCRMAIALRSLNAKQYGNFMTASKPKSSVFSSLETWLVDRINLFFKVRRYLKMITQRWALLLFCLLAGTGYQAWKAVHALNIYRATSLVQVAPKVTTANDDKVKFLEDLANFYEQQYIILESDPVRSATRNKVFEQFPKDPVYFSAVGHKNKGSLSMVVESSDFPYAASYASNWAQAFLERKKTANTQMIAVKLQETREQIYAQEKKLETQKRRIDDFKKEYNVVSIKDMGDNAQLTLDRLQDELRSIISQRETLESQSPDQLASINSSSRTTDKKEGSKTTALNDPTEQFKEPRYGELQLKKKELETEIKRDSENLLPKHPHMRMLQAQLARATESLDELTKMLNAHRDGAITVLKSKEASWKAQITAATEELKAARRFENDYLTLVEDLNTIKGQLSDTRRVEVALDASASSNDGVFEIIEAGVGSPSPVGPQRTRMVLNGLMVGLLIGLGIIYLLAQLDDRLELAEDIEKFLDVPVLGQIPLQNKKELGSEQVLLTRMDEHSLFAESIRGVRSAVLLGSRGEKRQVLLISSAAPGDGKTTFTVNFAVVLALAGNKVLLVDADLRRGNTNNYFSVPREPGFSDVLLGNSHWEDVVTPTVVNNLHTISSGKLPSNPGELLLSPITGEFIADARNFFDYVIFDCPPLTAIDDTFSLLPYADGLMFVVRAGQTSMRFAKMALESVSKRGATTLGLVVNGVESDTPYYYYRNYYHSYYRADEETRKVDPNAPTPAVKMAASKSRSRKFSSIEDEAKALAGEETTGEQPVESLSKAEQYRLRRAAADQNKDSGKV